MARRSAQPAQVTTIRQPVSERLADVLCQALANDRYTDLRAAIAYVTASGVQQLSDALHKSSLTVRWLTAFDWCRSEPAALSALDSAKRSAVRVFAGGDVVERAGCVPLKSFHPKSFLFTGPDAALLISGSGNLSANGLRHGIEFNTVISVDGPTAKVNASTWQAMSDVETWFDTFWRSADHYAPLADRYQAQFAERPKSSADMDFGDPPEQRTGRFTAEQLAQMAQASTMWIEAGQLTASTSNTPGHQLMMRPYSRVFFGFAATSVPRMTNLGEILVDFRGAGAVRRSIEFAHNSMDRLNLPASDGRDAAKYDGETLIFTKGARNGRVVYELALATPSEKTKLLNASRQREMAFKMSGHGRQFGFL